MASKQSTIDFILDQLQDAGEVSAKKMFGEYGIYLNGKMFALVCDDRLFFKSTDFGSNYFPEAEMAPPYPNAKPCRVIPEEKWDDSEWLVPLAIGTANELPLPHKKPKKA